MTTESPHTLVVPSAVPPGDLVSGLLLFVAAGIAMVLGALLIGRLVRPRLAHPEKGEVYECGEPAVGQSWVQFDLRFYVVALVFLIFDVEIALLYPWAVVFGGGSLSAEERAAADVLGRVKWAALWDLLFFLGVIVVGFLFLWRHGYLDWVRASTGGRTLASMAHCGAGVPPARASTDERVPASPPSKEQTHELD